MANLLIHIAAHVPVTHLITACDAHQS